jgi:DNA adenine methylase
LARIDETFHSRAQYSESKTEYISQADEITDPFACAWFVWVQTNMSFAKKIGGTFVYDRGGSVQLNIFNKNRNLTDAYQERMKRVTVECYDVIKVIKTYDAPDAFCYLDPPHVSSDQGHYTVYTLEDFRALLDVCR